MEFTPFSVFRGQALSVLAVTFSLAATYLPSQVTGNETAESDQTARIDFNWGARIPMRDGVELNATVYRPEGAGPLPVIFGMTPYIGSSYHPFATYYAKHGYVFAVVDARGRGNSEGEFHPFLQDAKDGHDVVEWLASQPFSDGRVAMFGGSYSGANQWATAKERPPRLVTIVPTAPAFAGIDFPGVNNIFRSYDMQWLTFTSGTTGNTQIFGDSEFWTDFYLDLYQGKTTFRRFDEWVGNPSKIYQLWVSHPANDEYWDSITPTERQFREIDLPVLSITGAYDGDQAGTLEFYRRHMALGSEMAKARHYLVIGPWDHGGTRRPQPTIGGLDIGDASLWDMNEFSLHWYDWTMKDGGKPEKLKDRVVYFTAGLNEWRSAPALDAIGTDRRRLFLDAAGVGSPTAYRSGMLTGEAPQAHTAYFVDDPLATAKTLARERNLAADYHNAAGWVVYQDHVLALEEDGLVYHSEPFAEPVVISGYVELQAWLSMDVPDTDMRASLYEILPDGSSILLTSDMMRARYRKSLREEELVAPGAIERYDFNRFTWFSRRIGENSRLRLVLDNNDTSAWQQNFNSGGVVADETPADARKATITLHQDAEHPSVLILPIDDL